MIRNPLSLSYPKSIRLTAVVILGLTLQTAPASAASQVFVTGFTKTNDIYTNLNQQFPNTGAGTPGTGVGTANSTFLFNPATYTSPNAVAGSNLTTNGTTFQLASDAAGHDFTEVNGSFVVPLNLTGVVSFHTLMGAYFGGSANVTFTGSAGAMETFSIALPDFSGGAAINQSSAANGSTTNNLFDQTVFQVIDVGAGGTGNSSNGAYGTYDLTEQSYILDSTFKGQTLASVTITPTGGVPLVLGLTADVPEPGTWATLLTGAGLLILGSVRRRRQASSEI